MLQFEALHFFWRKEGDHFVDTGFAPTGQFFIKPISAARACGDGQLSWPRPIHPVQFGVHRNPPTLTLPAVSLRFAWAAHPRPHHEGAERECDDDLRAWCRPASPSESCSGPVPRRAIVLQFAKALM